MAGTKRQRRPQAARVGLTTAIREMLWSGDLSVPCARAAGEIGKWGLALSHSMAADQRAEWTMHGDEVLADWVHRWPATRPWAWWAFEAAEPRRCLTDPGHVVGRGWRDNIGRCATPGHRVEGEGQYLERLGLLRPGERVPPAGRQPEVILAENDEGGHDAE
jgi:hypothetical protein